MLRRPTWKFFATRCWRARRSSATSRLTGGSVLPLVLAGLLLAQGALAYKIVLRDGTEIEAEGKYEVDGDRALFVLPNGSTSTIALAEIDVQKTEEANRRNLGDAVVINRDGTTTSYDPNASVREQPVDSLRELLKRRAALDRDTEERSPADRPLRKTAAGYPDFASIQRRPPRDADAGEQLANALQRAGLGSFNLYQGSTDGRLLLELTSNSQGDVFRQLSAIGAGLFEYYSTPGQPVETVEVLMRTGSQSRAGQFEFDQDDARLLVRGGVTPREFFVANVMF